MKDRRNRDLKCGRICVSVAESCGQIGRWTAIVATVILTVGTLASMGADHYTKKLNKINNYGQERN